MVHGIDSILCFCASECVCYISKNWSAFLIEPKQIMPFIRANYLPIKFPNDDAIKRVWEREILGWINKSTTSEDSIKHPIESTVTEISIQSNFFRSLFIFLFLSWLKWGHQLNSFRCVYQMYLMGLSVKGKKKETHKHTHAIENNNILRYDGTHIKPSNQNQIDRSHFFV